VLADVHLDPIVLAFALGASITTILLCGIWPASQLLSANVNAALRHGASGVVRSGSGARVRKLLVGVQMAISVVLLVGAGLLVRSVVQLEHIDVGFDTNNLFSVQLSLPRSHYEQPASRDAFSDQAIERLRAIPGVAGVTEAFMAPPNYVVAGGLEIRGVTLSEADARAAYAFNYVRPDFFSTLGIRLLQGRVFTAEDQRGGPVMIVNRSAATKFWPNASPIGAEIKFRTGWATVVGVVGDIAGAGRTGAPNAPLFYAPFTAEHAPTLIGALPRAVLLVRAAADPASVMGQVRAAINALDPEVAIPNMLLADTAYGRTMDRPRFNMVLLGAFAVVALLLAAVGLSAVIGYEVADRTHEIGVRVALGARAAQIRRVAMKHGLRPAALGIACGVVGALIAANLMAGLLYGVAPRDPLTFAGIVAGLVIVATVAAWIPARRATKIDPIVALRAD
jgi:putative ABC transport system permease protein